MASSRIQNLRDCTIISIIDIFGLSYFSFFSLHCLLFHFPSAPGAIISTLSVIYFSAGAIIWCWLSLIYRVISAIQGVDAAAYWQKLELGGLLLLIWTATLPAVVFLFPSQSYLQLGYLASFTVITIGNIVDLFIWDPSISIVRHRFPYHCSSLGLLSLVPAIHALTATPRSSPDLALQFCHMAIMNSLGAILYVLRPLERIGAFPGWRPSLYIMHLVLAYGIVSYSKTALRTALLSG